MSRINRPTVPVQPATVAKRPTSSVTNPVPRNQAAAPASTTAPQTPPSVGSYESDAPSFEKAPFGVPGAPRKPKGVLGRSMLWLYGDPKIGKTTFASQAPGTWFIATEKGQDWVEVREPTLIHGWTHFKDFIAYVNKSKPTRFADGTPIHTLALDRYEGLFRMCEEYVKSALGVEALDELGHGKGWARLTTEWEGAMNQIRRWPFGLIAISHARTKEFKTRVRKFDRYEPDVGAAGFRWALGAADFILFARTEETLETNSKGEPTGRVIEKRILQCQPTSTAVAGGRMSHLLPATLPLGYEYLRKAIEEPNG